MSGYGQGFRKARGEMCPLTVPSTFQEMVGRGCPEASQDRFNSVFFCTHTFLCFNAIHGGPGEAGGEVRQQTPPAHLLHPTEHARAAGG